MRAWFARAWARIRRLSSAQVSATVGFTALLFTLAYNGYSIRAQTEQSRQQVEQTQRQTREAEETRIAGEVSLLSQLNQTFNALDQELGETKAEDWICDPNHGKRSLPRSDELVLYRALDYYDCARLAVQSRPGQVPGRARVLAGEDARSQALR